MRPRMNAVPYWIAHKVMADPWLHKGQGSFPPVIHGMPAAMATRTASAVPRALSFLSNWAR